MVSRVVDGDTVEMSTGQTIRIIGVDTPEVGQPCYAEAAAALRAVVQGQPVRLTPGARDDVDRYGRLLRYLDTAGGVDAGLQMINQGWAIARFDSRDGYGRHAREASYVAADAASLAQACGSVPAPPPAGAYVRQLCRRSSGRRRSALLVAARLPAGPRRRRRRRRVRVSEAMDARAVCELVYAKHNRLHPNGPRTRADTEGGPVKRQRL